MASIEKIDAPENIQFPNVLSHAVKIPGLVFCSGQVIFLTSNESYLILYGGCLRSHLRKRASLLKAELRNTLSNASRTWETSSLLLEPPGKR
jgi:enamine deaminase RidA (YjgF/YER057c/UK114 family)